MKSYTEHRSDLIDKFTAIKAYLSKDNRMKTQTKTTSKGKKPLTV